METKKTENSTASHHNDGIKMQLSIYFCIVLIMEPNFLLPAAKGSAQSRGGIRESAYNESLTLTCAEVYGELVIGVTVGYAVDDLVTVGAHRAHGRHRRVDRNVFRNV